MRRPVLWQFTSSHFNEKVRWALDFKRVPHVRRSLLPGPHARKIRRMTGQTAVPVLELDGRPISDSTRIIAALEEAYPEPPLYPREEADQRRALALEDFFDEELGPHIRRVAFHLLLPFPDTAAGMFTHDSGPVARIAFRATFPMIRARVKKALRDEAETDLARAKTVAALDRVAEELEPYGYLVGDRFTVADLTAAALLSPLVGPPEFPYPLPEPLPEPIIELRLSFSTHPAFGWVLEMYRRHRGRSAAVEP